MADYSSEIELAFRTTGMDAITSAENAITGIKDAQSDLAQKFSDSAITVNEFVAAASKMAKEMETAKAILAGLSAQTSDYADMQAKLGQMETTSADAAAQAAMKTAAAKEQGTAASVAFVKALQDEKAAAAAAYEAEIRGIGERAQAYARAERQQEAADKASAESAGAAQRARIDSLARAEREQEALDKAGAQSAGDAQRARIEAYARAEREIERATKEANAAYEASMQRRVESAKKYQDAILAMGRAERDGLDTTAKATTATTQAGNAAGNSAYKWLYLSNAVQDSQYGFSAIVNNIPGIIQGFGGGPGLAGAVQILAVGFTALKPQLMEIGKYLDLVQDKSKMAAVNMAQMGEKIDAINEKPVKLAADFSAIEALKKELDKAKKEIEAFEAVKNAKTDFQTEGAKRAFDAVRDSGGGENVQKAYIQANPNLAARSPANDQLRRVNQYMKKFDDGTATNYEAYSRWIFEKISGSVVAMRDNLTKQVQDDVKEFAERDIGAALLGTDERGRKRLETSIRAKPDVYSKAGVKLGLANQLADASADTVRNDALAKQAAENEAEYRAQAKKEADAKQREEDFNRKRDSDNESKQNAARLKGDQFAEQEAKRKQREKDAQLKQDAALAAKQANDRDQLARKLGAGFVPQIEAGFAENILRRETGLPVADSRRQEDQLRNSGQDYARSDRRQAQVMQAETAQRLHRAGQDPSLAENIIGQSLEKFRDSYTGAMATTNNREAALRSMLGQLTGLVNQQVQQAAASINMLGNAQAGINKAQAGTRQNGANLRRLQTQRPTLLSD